MLSRAEFMRVEYERFDRGVLDEYEVYSRES